MTSNMPTSSDEAKSHINVNSTEASSMTDSEKCISYNDVQEVTAGSSSTLVTWDGPNDPQCPQNWSNARKLPAVLSICSIAFSTSFSSSVFAPAAVPVAAEFGVSNTIATLGVSLYVLGFAAGPLLWGPLSEAFGRTRPLFVALLLFVVFQIPVAVSKNIGEILVFRFLSGASGSAAFAIPPAMAVDFLTPAQRLFAINFYMTFTFFGPVAGPIAGAYLTVHHGWRWTGWISLIIGGICSLFAILTIPESSEDILLQRKARRLRQDSGNSAIKSRRDEQPVTFKNITNRYMVKPIRMLVTEPILLVVTIYCSLVYGLLYLLFFAYPYCFQVIRGWQPQHSSLPFLGILVGVFLGCLGVAISDATWWLKRYLARGRIINPEDRLAAMAASAILLPIGLFWFAWTSNPSVHWAAQVCSGLFTGAGIVLNLLSTTSYVVEVHLLDSSSAIAANVCVRSATAAAFPLFAVHMFERLGTEWATSLLAFFCLALAPVPFLFWRYGAKIRSWSAHSLKK